VDIPVRRVLRCGVRHLADYLIPTGFAVLGAAFTFEIGPHLGSVLTAIINAGGAGMITYAVRRWAKKELHPKRRRRRNRRSVNNQPTKHT